MCDKKIQIHRRHDQRNNPKIPKYCRRHGFGENTEEGSDAAELIVKDQNCFQIATTVQKLKVSIRSHGGSWVEPLPISEKIGRYVTVISRDITSIG